MKKLRVYTGCRAEGATPYEGQYIYSVKETRVHQGVRYICLEHDIWIREVGPEKYVTDWTTEEIWGRVEEVDVDGAGAVLSAEEKGFIILHDDRAKGILYDPNCPNPNLAPMTPN